jgi:hypothetical protein
MTPRSGFGVRRFYGASGALIRPSLRDIGPRIENAQGNRPRAHNTKRNLPDDQELLKVFIIGQRFSQRDILSSKHTS